jgi:two-component system, LuxR family, sensor kinase FixL
MNRTTSVPASESRSLTVSDLTALLDHASDFVGVATLGGDMEFLNRAGRALIGLDATAELPAHLTDYLPDSSRDLFARTILPQLRHSGHWEGELMLHRLDDASPSPVFARIFYLQHGARGRRVSIAAVCRDLSAGRLAEERLRTAESALAYATRLNSMGEITASIAHEVSQPLAAILTHGNACLRWLTHAKLDIDEARTAAIRIVRDANRASLVLDRIRDLARREVPAWAPFDLNESIREIMALLGGEIRHHHVDLTLALADDLPAVRGDGVQVQQVLLNLAMNGIEAMLDVEGRPRRLVISSLPSGPHFVEIRIRDSGHGISASDLRHVFEPFFTTKQQGMGLGLSIAQRVVRDHGGTLSASVNPDHGATVSFTLACRREIPA